jgi:hypothetical protein
MPSYSHDQQQAVSIYPAIWNDVRDSKALIKARKRSDVCEDRKKEMRLSVPPHGVRHPSKVSNSIAQPMVSLICGLQASTDRRAITGNKLLRDAGRKVISVACPSARNGTLPPCDSLCIHRSCLLFSCNSPPNLVSERLSPQSIGTAS